MSGRAGACSRRTRTEAGTKAVTAGSVRQESKSAAPRLWGMPSTEEPQQACSITTDNQVLHSPRLSSCALGSGTTVLLPLMTAPLAGRCCCCSLSMPPGGGGKGGGASCMCTSAGRAITPRGGGPA